MLAFARETWYLGLRTLRRFLRVPANPISTVIFPLIQLVGFSQLFRDIIQLPGFAGQTSYLAYLAPGQIAFTVFLAVSWSGSNLLYDYRNGYLDKLRAAPIRRYSILAGELVPLGLECAAMAGVILLVSVALGASVATGFVGAVLILVLCAAFGVAWSGTSFLPALLTKNEQATARSRSSSSHSPSCPPPSCRSGSCPTGCRRSTRSTPSATSSRRHGR